MKDRMKTGIKLIVGGVFGLLANTWIISYLLHVSKFSWCHSPLEFTGFIGAIFFVSMGIGGMIFVIKATMHGMKV